jgi:Na+/citrate or Na+/malate symporter
LYQFRTPLNALQNYALAHVCLYLYLFLLFIVNTVLTVEQNKTVGILESFFEIVVFGLVGGLWSLSNFEVYQKKY